MFRRECSVLKEVCERGKEKGTESVDLWTKPATQRITTGEGERFYAQILPFLDIFLIV